MHSRVRAAEIAEDRWIRQQKQKHEENSVTKNTCLFNQAAESSSCTQSRPETGRVQVCSLQTKKLLIVVCSVCATASHTVIVTPKCLIRCFVGADATCECCHSRNVQHLSRHHDTYIVTSRALSTSRASFGGSVLGQVCKRNLTGGCMNYPLKLLEMWAVNSLEVKT